MKEAAKYKEMRGGTDGNGGVCSARTGRVHMQSGVGGRWERRERAGLLISRPPHRYGSCEDRDEVKVGPNSP